MTKNNSKREFAEAVQDVSLFAWRIALPFSLAIAYRPGSTLQLVSEWFLALDLLCGALFSLMLIINPEFRENLAEAIKEKGEALPSQYPASVKVVTRLMLIAAGVLLQNWLIVGGAAVLLVVQRRVSVLFKRIKEEAEQLAQ